MRDEATNYPQIVDGFSYAQIFGTRPNNRMNWYQTSLANLEDLRVAADSYRPRWWVVPKNFIDPLNAGSVNILPGKTVFYEFQVKDGSFLWGLQFAVLQGIGGVETVPQSTFSVVIRQGAELPFFDRVMTCSGIADGNPADPLNTLFPAVNPLHRPRLIIPPAQLHVEISNDSNPTTNADSVSVQLLMLFAEPK